MKKHDSTKTVESEESVFSQLDPEAIKEAASNAGDAAAKFIKKHPLESVGGALLIGLLVGLFIKRNRN